MKAKRKQFYLVREDVLSESMEKTIQAKRLLEEGKIKTVNEAVKTVDMSRSAFYKYRECIFPFQTMVNEQIVSLFIDLHDQSGALSELLGVLAKAGCNVLTIHQTIPLQGRANISLSIKISEKTDDMNDVLDALKKLEPVRNVGVIGTGG